MRYFYSFSLFAICLIFACDSNKTVIPAGKKTEGETIHQTLNVTDFKVCENAENIILLDVRTIEEFAEGHIQSAINIDLNDNFEKRINNIDSTLPIYVYCQSGKRGARAAEILAARGFRKVYNLDGGIEAWIEAELEVVTNKPF